MESMTQPVGPDLDVLLTHAEFVRAAARGVLGGDGEVEDVVQETWLRALGQQPRDPGALRGWLRRVARNLAIDVRRRGARRTKREQVAARPEALPVVEDLLEREEARRRLVSALLALEAPSRDALLLRYYEGLSVPDVARRLDVPVETARTRLRRGLERLRSRLGGTTDGRAGAWSLGLVPWAVDRGSAALAGGVAMKKLGTAALLVVLIGGGAGLALHTLRERTPDAGQGAVLEVASGGAGGAATKGAGPTLLGSPAPQAALPAPVDLEGADRDLDVFGVVVDGTGQPVPGASLQVVRHPWRRGVICAPGCWSVETAGPATLSAVDGTFSMRLTRGARFDLRVAARGFATLDRRGCLAGQRLRIVMTPGATWVLELSAEDQSPLAGTRVHLRGGAHAERSFERDAVADADGRVRVEGLPGPARMFATVEPARLGMLYSWVQLPADGEHVTRLTLPLGRTITGRVTTAETGAPIGDASVAIGWWRAREVRTDAEGRYTLTGWHARQGADELSVSAPGRGTVKVVVAERSTVDVALALGDRVVGRVLAPGGRPLGRTSVALVPGGPGAGSVNGDTAQVVETGTDGRFAFEGVRRDQDHAVVVLAPGFGRTLLDLAPHPSEPGTVDVGDITLSAGQAIEGRVLDASGAPLPDMQVELLGANADRRRHIGTDATTEAAFYGQTEDARSDDLGRFRFVDLAPGRYRITLRQEGRPDVRTFVDLRAGQDRRGVELRQPAGGRELVVRVVDWKGRPVPAAWVTVEGGASSSNGVTVDAEGYATVFVLPDQKTLRVSPTGGATGEPALLSVWGVPIPRDETSIVLTLVEAATLSGVVQDPSGRALPGVSVEVLRKDHRTVTLLSGSAGEFRHDLPVGTRVDLRVRWLQVPRPGGGQENVPAQGALLDVVAGDRELVLTATALPLDRELRVVVRKPDGSPWVGARVSLARDGGMLWREAITDAEGRVSIPRLSDDPWDLFVNAPLGAPQPQVSLVHHPITVRPAGQEVEVEMVEAVVVTGRIVAAREADLVGATVGLLAPGATAVARPVPCNRSGVFRLAFHPDAPRPWVLEARSVHPAPPLLGRLELDGPPTAAVTIELRTP
jgi:RNA polymerase sigma-70 factor (ECF subfamily)